MTHWTGKAARGEAVNGFYRFLHAPTNSLVVGVQEPAHGRPGTIAVHHKGGRWWNNAGGHYTGAHIAVWELLAIAEDSFEVGRHLLTYEAKLPYRGPPEGQGGLGHGTSNSAIVPEQPIENAS